ncbi:MAG: hypothetical protein J0L61_02385 [Planctomycetes bacterium]|nr:hypothetical protein [Planctomycetota bacterium]
MVRHGIRGAVIALVGGTAVATAMGVLSQSRSGGSNLSSVNAPSQRVSYKIDYSPAVLPSVRHGEQGQGAIGNMPSLPDFMTRDVASSRPVPAGARLAADTALQAPAPTTESAPFVANFAAGARSGGTNGPVIGFNGRRIDQSTLDADLAQSAPQAQRSTLGSQAGFSRSPSTNAGFDTGDLFPFSGPDVQDVAQNAQTNPGETNSTVNPGTGPAANPALPPSVATAGQGGSSVTGNDGSPAQNTSSSVPTPGAAALLALGGLAAGRRKR